MKTLNVIDLAVQSFILGSVVLLSLAISFTGEFDSIALLAMYGAFFLGPWQLVSSLITCIARGLYLKWRLIHLISSIVYLVLISVGALFANDLDPEGFVRTVGGVVGFAIPVVLAFFYYYITVKSFTLSRAAARTRAA